MKLKLLYLGISCAFTLKLHFLICNLPLSLQRLTDMTIEILARLFVLSLGDIESSKTMHDNLHNRYYVQENKNANEEADIKTLRRYEEKLRHGHNAFLEYYGLDNAYLIKEENLRRIGRTYDNANLELILSKINSPRNDLLHFLIKNMITDSNKVSDKEFVDAYKSFDQKYEDAKKCSDKLQYITKWIDFCRMETKYHFSLIPQIADYMSEHKNMPLDGFVNFWGSYIEEGKPIEAYQLLRYHMYIDYFKKDCSADMAQYVLQERAISSAVCSKFRNVATEVFMPFYDGDSKAIDEMYKFCHDTYPIIELHNTSNFYLSDGKKLNRPKIKCARKIIDYLLCPKELSAFFSKTPSK